MMNIFVNGYGAPKDPKIDGNLTRYLGAVMEFIKSRPDDYFVIYLAGGYTNRKDMSEARAMLWWLRSHVLPNNVEKITLIEGSTTGRDNLRLYSEMVPHTEPSVFFCERSREPHVKFFVKRFFPHSKKELFTFIGVPFDAKSLKPTNRAKEYLFKYPLMVLSWYFPFIDKYIVKPIRNRHVAKCRKEMLSK